MSRGGTWLRGFACVWLAVGPVARPAVVHAEPTTAEKKQTAKSYVDAGLQAQKTGDYDTAIILYQKAYDLVPHPVLLFNLAQAHRLAGRIQKALELYRDYLEEDPQGSESATARELIGELEARQRAEGRKAKKPRRDGDDSAGPAPPPAPADPGTDDAHASPRDHERVSEAGPVLGPEPAPLPAREPADRGDEPVAHAAAATPPLIHVGLGSSVVHRGLSYDTRPNFAQAPPAFSTTAFTIRVEGEIYPFALASPSSALAGLGFVASYDDVISLHLKNPTVDNIPADQSYYMAGARYRFGLAADWTLALGLDYVHRQFLVGSAMSLLDIPDIDYSAVAPAAAVRVQATPSVAVFGSLEGLLTLDAGPIQDPSSYGRSTTYGATASLGAELALTDRLRLRLLVEYNRIDFAFDGNGLLASDRDSDPTTQDVNGATDQSISASATLGLAY
ncbi:MAG TPA: tetratricopeptide repeat protein [Kofleriaceae bacterium]|nr:tetratricopeptide repeat protein [Kofleriaceae bacterium]